jgi:hypothetical protein
MSDKETALLYLYLFKRCEAVRPKRPGGYSLRCTSDESVAWYGSITRDIQLADEWDAVNACRCAVEDWIVGEGYHQLTWDHDSNKDEVVLELYDIEASGKTHHHALIAAAHAVLDAQGVTQ